MSTVPKLPPVKQRVCGHELRGKAFITNPGIIEFNDFVPGQVYKQKIEVTNCSLTFNSFKIEPIPAEVCDILEVQWTPAGRMSAGMKTFINVIFKPKYDEDIATFINVTCTTGPERFDVVCRSKKLDLHFIPPARPVLKRRRPRASPPDPFDPLHHPDAPSEKVYICKYDMGKISRGSTQTGTITIKNIGARDSPFLIQLLNVKEHRRRDKPAQIEGRGIDLGGGLTVGLGDFDDGAKPYAIRPNAEDEEISDEDFDENEQTEFSDDDMLMQAGVSLAQSESTTNLLAQASVDSSLSSFMPTGGRMGAKLVLPKRVGSDVGELTLPRARGVVNATSSVGLEFCFSAKRPGRLQTKLKLDFASLGASLGIPKVGFNEQFDPKQTVAPSVELWVRVECVEEPIQTSRTEIDLGTLIEDKIYKERLEFMNLRTQERSLTLSQTCVAGLEIGSQAKDDIEELMVFPCTGVVQGLKSFFVALKFTPKKGFLTRYPDLRDVPATKRLQDKIKDTCKGPVHVECFKIILTFKAAGQDWPINITLKGAITSGHFETFPSRFNFGRVELGCMSHCELRIYNPSSKPLFFKFPWLHEDVSITRLPDHVLAEAADWKAYDSIRQELIQAREAALKNLEIWEAEEAALLQEVDKKKKPTKSTKGVADTSDEILSPRRPKPEVPDGPRISQFGSADTVRCDVGKSLKLDGFLTKIGVKSLNEFVADQQFLGCNVDSTLNSIEGILEPGELRRLVLTYRPTSKGFLTESFTLRGYSKWNVVEPGALEVLPANIAKVISGGGAAGLAAIPFNHEKIIVCEGRAVRGAVTFSKRAVTMEPIPAGEKCTESFTITNSSQDSWQEVVLVPPHKLCSKLKISPKCVILPPLGEQTVTITFMPLNEDAVKMPEHPLKRLNSNQSNHQPRLNNKISEYDEISEESLNIVSSPNAEDAQLSLNNNNALERTTIDDFAEELILRQAAVSSSGGQYRVAKVFNYEVAQDFRWVIPVIRRKIIPLPDAPLYNPLKPDATSDVVMIIGSDPIYMAPKFSTLQVRTSLVPAVISSDVQSISLGDVNVQSTRTERVKLFCCQPEFIQSVKYTLHLPTEPTEEMKAFKVFSLGPADSFEALRGHAIESQSDNLPVVGILQGSQEHCINVSLTPDLARYYNTVLTVSFQLKLLANSGHIPGKIHESMRLKGSSQDWWNSHAPVGGLSVIASSFSIPITATAVAPTLIVEPADGIVDAGAVVACAPAVASPNEQNQKLLYGRLTPSILVRNPFEFAITVRIRRDLSAAASFSSVDSSEIFEIIPSSITVPPRTSTPISFRLNARVPLSGVLRERIELWSPNQIEKTFVYLHARVTAGQAWVDTWSPASKFSVQDSITTAMSSNALARVAAKVVGDVNNSYGSPSKTSTIHKLSVKFPSPEELKSSVQIYIKELASQQQSQQLNPSNSKSSPAGKGFKSEISSLVDPRTVQTILIALGCAKLPTIDSATGLVSTTLTAVGAAQSISYDFSIEPSFYSQYFSLPQPKGIIQVGQQIPLEIVYKPPPSALEGGSDMISLGASVLPLAGVGMWVSAKAKGVLVGGIESEGNPSEVHVTLNAYMPSV